MNQYPPLWGDAQSAKVLHYRRMTAKHLRALLRRLMAAVILIFSFEALAEETGIGLSVQVIANSGAYCVKSRNPGWVFAGSLGVPLENLATGEGHDALGDYRETSFEWRTNKVPMSGQIRLYEKQSVALFSQTCLTATEIPPAAFPAFTNLPQSLHIFSYGHHEFAPPHFSANEISTPWLLFDDDANAFLISPASHFMVASMLGDGRTKVASGFNPQLRSLPAGFTQETLVVLGHGINKTWDLWGRTLLALHGAKRPASDTDTVSKYLGYWTDNGAYYYYNYDFDKGYAGTLQSLVERYRQEEIPIRYLQLDSWWYSKTTIDAEGKPGKEKKVARLPAGEWNRYGGLLEYKAHPDLFPHGLDAFQKSIGLPLVTHSRWIDRASPYHQHYQISGVAATDPKWWDSIADYMKVSGIATYEQDWLDRIYTYSPAFSSNAGTAEMFLDNMARACQERGITLQYCMPYASHFMQGSCYGNLTTIRASGDRFNANHWNDFLYTSRLASSLGIWPWADVYMSGETNNLLLSTLSAGPVGIGDALGAENKDDLLHAVRADGVIVKPDVPMVPLDRTYLADAKDTPAPLTASTYTENGGTRTAYVFAFNRHKTPADEVHYTLDELGVNGPAYVYNYFSDSGGLVSAKTDFSAPLGKNASAFYVVAPVGKSGIAFLGDKNKFVGTGRQRIASLRDEPGKLTVEVVMAATEKPVTLQGFATSAPTAEVLAGEDDNPQYDPLTKRFTVVVKADPAAPLDRSGSDPVRRITVVLATGTAK
jgi:hypothetical protein